MRVAALLPAATDIVIAPGAGDRLVAVTHACAVPSRLAHLPRVTRSRIATLVAAGVDARVGELAAAGAPLFDIDEAALAATRPDVILTQAVCDVCAVREEDARAVASRLHPSPTVTTLGASTVDGVLADILAVGIALDVEDADELVLGLRSRLRAVHRALKAAQAPRPRILVLEWTDPPFNAGHWVPDMVRRAGGDEVLGQIGAVSTRVSVDEVRRANPDIVVIAPCGYELHEASTEATSLTARDAWQWLHPKPVWAINANRLTSAPSPNVVHGVEVLSQILHPALFGHPSTDLAQLV
jgi:iron complex transport system substrate-binding protein